MNTVRLWEELECAKEDLDARVSNDMYLTLKRDNKKLRDILCTMCDELASNTSAADLVSLQSEQRDLRNEFDENFSAATLSSDLAQANKSAPSGLTLHSEVPASHCALLSGRQAVQQLEVALQQREHSRDMGRELRALRGVETELLRVGLARDERNLQTELLQRRQEKSENLEKTSDLSAELAEREAELVSANEYSVGLLSELGSFEQELQEVTRVQVLQRQEARQELKEYSVELQSELVSFEHEMREVVREEADQRQEARKDSEDNVSFEVEMEQELEVTRKNCISCQQQLAFVDGELQDARGRNETLEAQMQKQHVESGNLQANLFQIKQEQAVESATAKKISDDLHSELTLHIRELHDVVTRNEFFEAQMQKQHIELNDLQAELLQMKQARAEESTTAKKNSDELWAEWSLAKHERQDAIVRNQSLKMQLQKHHVAFDNLQAELLQIKQAQAGELSVVNKRSDDLWAELAVVEQERKNAVARNQTFEVQMHKHHAEVDDLLVELLQMKQEQAEEVSTAKKKSDDLHAELVSVERDLQNVDARNESLETQMQKRQFEYMDLQAKLLQMKKERTEELAIAKKSSVDLCAELASVECKQQDVVASEVTFEAQMQKRQFEFHDLQAEFLQMKEAQTEELAIAKESSEDLRTKLALAGRELQDVIARNETTEAQMQKLHVESDYLQAMLVNANSDSDDLRAKLTSVESELHDVIAGNENTEAKSQKHQLESNGLEAELVPVKRDSQHARAINETIEQRVEHKHKCEATNLSDELQRLRNQFVSEVGAKEEHEVSFKITCERLVAFEAEESTKERVEPMHQELHEVLHKLAQETLAKEQIAAQLKIAEDEVSDLTLKLISSDEKLFLMETLRKAEAKRLCELEGWGALTLSQALQELANERQVIQCLSEEMAWRDCEAKAEVYHLRQEMQQLADGRTCEALAQEQPAIKWGVLQPIDELKELHPVGLGMTGPVGLDMTRPIGVAMIQQMGLDMTQPIDPDMTQAIECDSVEKSDSNVSRPANTQEENKIWLEHTALLMKKWDATKLDARMGELCDKVRQKDASQSENSESNEARCYGFSISEKAMKHARIRFSLEAQGDQTHQPMVKIIDCTWTKSN